MTALALTPTLTLMCTRMSAYYEALVFGQKTNVYCSRHGTIYLCGAFWDAPVTVRSLLVRDSAPSQISISSVQGTDSRGGTLVHESSHFTNM